jgi:flagellar biosynthetic protein FliR
MSNVVDPATGVNSPLVTHLYETMFFLALLAVDGHHWVIRALSASNGRAPVGALDAGRALPEVALAMFEQMFAAGLTFAAPILVLLMLVSLLIGLLTRAVPQINVLEFGFNLRIVAGLAGMLLFAPLLAPALQALLDHLLEGLNASLDALEVV